MQTKKRPESIMKETRTKNENTPNLVINATKFRVKIKQIKTNFSLKQFTL